ncbi:MAG: serine/threonine-protein kinase, partial [Polyangiaceae bacterium]
VGEESKIVADGKLRYELAHRLGEGGVGEVIKARDNDIDRDVAIKRLRGEMKGSHATVLRFAEEVRTVGKLEHPNIVPIHDVGVHPNGEYFFVMKYVDGETLESIIDKLAAGNAEYHAKYDFERRVELMMGVLEAIAYAHSKKLIHRDIKPANVMVGPYGEVVVMDWGLAREISGPEPVQAKADAPEASGPRKLFQTRVGAVLGTPAYMSPEQARGQELDERSDVYSLSMLFYELLTLQHPLASQTSLERMLEAVKNEVTPHAIFQPTVAAQGKVPAELSWFLERGLRKDKSERFQSVDDMVERLRNRAAGDIPVQCSTTLSIRATTLLRQALVRWPHLAVWAIFFALISLVALAGVGVMHLVAH